MAGSLASINIKFQADLSQFSSELQNSMRTIEKAGQKMQNIGAGLSVGLTLPLLGLGGVAVKSAADLETLKTSLNTVFNGNTQAAETAFKSIKNFASTTPYAVEEVTQAFIKLKNLGLNASENSLRSYGNTASALGKSLDQMIEAVADASVGEFERLKEFGIKAKSEGDKVSFTFQGVTTTVGKNSAEIESYLANIGNVNFAGAMEKQSQTFNGRLSNLKDNVESVFSSFGEIILEAVAPLVEWVGKAAAALNNLDPSVKRVVVIVGALLAAAGPLILAFGTFATLIPTLTAGIAAIGGAFTLMTGPVGLIALAIGAIITLIIRNWATVKKYIIDTVNYFIDLYNSSKAVRLGVEAIILMFKNLWEAGKFVINAIIDGFKLMGKQILNVFSTIGDLTKAILTGNFKDLPGILKESFSKALNNGKSFVSELGTDFNSFTSNVKKNFDDALSNIGNNKYKLVGENIDTKEVEDTVASAVSAGLNKGLSGKEEKRPKLEALKPNFIGFKDSAELEQIKGIQVLIDGYKKLQETQVEGSAQWKAYEAVIKDHEATINAIKLSVQVDPPPVEGLIMPIVAAGEQVKSEFDKMKENADEFNEGIASIMENVANNFAVGFGEMIGQSMSGSMSIKSIWVLMMSTLADMAIQVGKIAIGIGFAVEGIKKALTSLNPVVAIAAGIALIALGTFAKSAISNVAGFKDGGIVGGNSFYGDKILARVNSGELILNQKQQQSLYGALDSSGQNVNIGLDGAFKISGSDLELVIDRAIERNNRKR